ncbi:MAG: hypothetical protein ACI4EU_06920 [Butyrivibrio sp.]
MKHLKKIYALLAIVLSFSFLTIPQNVYAKNANKEKEIEEIIEESSTDSPHKKMTDKEIEAFLINDDVNSQNALEGKTTDEIERYFASVEAGNSEENTNGGLVTNPITYLHNTVGRSTDTYTITKTKTIPGVGNRTCTDLGGHNNCTLTSLSWYIIEI